MYSVLSSLISLSTSKESEMFLLTGSYSSDCKDLRKHLKKMRTWQPNWGTPIGAYKYIYRAHSAVFSAAEYTFQSTQLGFPNWGFLPCTCNSEWPNWGGFLNRKSFLIDVMPYVVRNRHSERRTPTYNVRILRSSASHPFGASLRLPVSFRQ